MKLRHIALFIAIVAVAPGFVGGLCQQLTIGLVDALSHYLHSSGVDRA